MKMKILQDFTGYPKGIKTSFVKGSKVEISKEYANEAKLCKKGLAEAMATNSV